MEEPTDETIQKRQLQIIDVWESISENQDYIYNKMAIEAAINQMKLGNYKSRKSYLWRTFWYDRWLFEERLNDLYVRQIEDLFFRNNTCAGFDTDFKY